MNMKVNVNEYEYEYEYDRSICCSVTRKKKNQILNIKLHFESLNLTDNR